MTRYWVAPGGRAARCADAYRKYVAACARHANTPPLPVTADKAAGFALGECLHGMSSRTLGSVVTLLLSYATAEALQSDTWTAPVRTQLT